MLKLRELIRDDLSNITRWRSDRQLIDCLEAPYRYIGPEIDEVWFDSYLKNRSSTVRCAIVDDRNEGDILGLATLASIDWVHRSCEFHIMIGNSDCRGKGLGTFALGEMLRHAFLDLGLNRVELSVLEDNVRARHVYEKVGFVLEGTRRKAVYKNGKYVDMHIMGLLRDEWIGLEGAR